MIRLIIRLMVAAFAIFLILFGIIAMISPIPFGIFMVAIGLALLASTFPGVVRWARRRWGWLDMVMDRLSPFLPDWLKAPMERSDPDHEDDEDDEDGESRQAREALHGAASMKDPKAEEARRILML